MEREHNSEREIGSERERERDLDWKIKKMGI